MTDMDFLAAITVGGLTTAGVYLVLRRSVVRLIMGLALLSQAANISIFAAGGMTRANSPIIREGATELVQPFADPLPQALILTAIVIGFGLQAFTVVLIRQTYRTTGTDDLDRLNTTDT